MRIIGAMTRLDRLSDVFWSLFCPSMAQKTSLASLAGSLRASCIPCRDARPRGRGWNRNGLALLPIDAQPAEHGAMQVLWDRLHMTELWDEWVLISVWP